MNAELTFSPSTSFFQPNTGTLSFMAINNSLTRMVVTTDGYDHRYGQIYYFTRASSTDTWSVKTQIQGIPVSGIRWTCASMSADGSRLVVVGYGIPIYVFRWVNGTYAFQGTISIPDGTDSAGLNMTSDGSRFVVTTINGYTYYSAWNNSTNNYGSLVQTLDTTLRNVANNQYANLAMSSNGNRIAFCDYNNQSVPSFIFADWNGSNYGPYTVITALTGHLTLCSGGALSPDGGCLIVDAQQPKYGYFNSVTGNFGPFVNMPTSIMPQLNGLYYINIFTITHDGLHLFWNLNRDDMTIKMIPIEYSTPPLYLGDAVTIYASTVNFNDSNVVVKAPNAGLHLANKKYVDDMVDATHAVILENAGNDTVSTTEYSNLIAERQVVQSDLATQINNLYQYFFNKSRAEAVLFYSILTSPLDAEGCSLWLDGADLSAVVRSGSYVTSWNDKSIQNVDFIQANTVNSPTYTTNAINGKSVLSFNPTSSPLYLVGPSTGLEIGTNSFCMFIVCEVMTSNGFLMNKGYNVEPEQGQIRFSFGGGNLVDSVYHNNFGLQETAMPSMSGYNILQLVINRRQGVDTAYFNGSIPLNSNAWNSSRKTYTPDYTMNVFNGNSIVLGAYNVNGVPITSPSAGAFVGNIAEAVAYTNPYDLTDSIRYQIEGYLAHKWGLQSKLPSSHPFKVNTFIRS